MKKALVPRPYLARLRTAATAAAVFCVLPAPVLSQDGIQVLETQHNKSQVEFQDVNREIALTEKRLAEIAAEIDTIRNDNAAITAALIQAAKTERKLSEDIDTISLRLTRLRHEESYLRESLQSRRGVLAEVLGALQRMGLNPPPAILVRPEDALASVRSAILLGAVVPELRAETEILIGDLRDLSRIVTSIEGERDKLQKTVTGQAEEKKRLALLLDEKKRLQQEAENRMAAEQQQAEALAARATSLQELIGSLETEISSLRKAEAERARRLSEPTSPENRLGAGATFAKRTGGVALPVSGQFAARFGEDDDTGAPLQGDILRTQSGAIVTAPAGATVLYAGPFRSYGQLLILNAGDGYHIVLAGLDKVSVTLGQSVLAGEPIGMMGEARLASIAGPGTEDVTPELYVEFRKNGKPIDPKPWWAPGHSGRTGNET
ncbi:peptidase M23B [Nitratireductor aquibiodomus RA22]|uniref:Septal ring factor EnvC, activator of murein hydrolases AmiA and AmiB n=2 Tax=Nitratireductor aquibiodomus TaxID=204799 RepID=A0A1H4K8F5_9HYPH|nr:murein hydrolase activator EnvC [Nitratireductor aquibiodomus]EIM73753.1 peptidase M23B [Nitratireductor aquibiodomus RA22]SEB54824.1 Septal ring factor EnvC, activator of murein hydrolases AmiA and AmiB [Nitratireductor aquibiodomus]